MKGKRALCNATGDPHIRTFDGLYYHMFYVGDYVMMQSAGERTEVRKHLTL